LEGIAMADKKPVKKGAKAKKPASKKK